MSYETFLNQNIDIFWKNIKSKGKATLGTLLDFAYFSSYLKTKETTSECGNAIFLEPEMLRTSLCPFWKAHTKIEQLKTLMALSLEGRWNSRQFQWFFGQYNNFSTKNAIKLINTIKVSFHEHLSTYKISSLFKNSCLKIIVRLFRNISYEIKIPYLWKLWNYKGYKDDWAHSRTFL